MKKLLPLFFLGLSLASCSKKGDDPTPAPVVTPSLVGTWNVTSIKVVSTANAANGGATTTSTTSYAANAYNFTFTTDNKLIQTLDKTISPTGVGVAYTTLYTYSNGIIVSIDNASSATNTFKVESLTDKMLVLSSTENSPTSINNYTVTLTR